MARQTVYDIELGGASRRLNFGTACWEFFCEKMDIGPSDILLSFTSKTAFRAMRILVYSAIAADDFLKGEPTSVTEREVAVWLNDDSEKLTEVFAIAVSVLVPELEPLKDDIPQEVDDGTKKKRSPSRKSKG